MTTELSPVMAAKARLLPALLGEAPAPAPEAKPEPKPAPKKRGRPRKKAADDSASSE